jgi:hypothetical protein
MNTTPKLYMLIIGCLPTGRLTEQHDIFFGIAPSLSDLIPAIKNSWPEAKGILHVDAWRQVNVVGEYQISVTERNASEAPEQKTLFFINLGGYKPGEFEEFHYKMLSVAIDKAGAIKEAKETAFYKHTGFKGAASHIDDKYGVDVDDIHAIEEILSKTDKTKYKINITPIILGEEDPLHIGYFKLDKLSD